MFTQKFVLCDVCFMNKTQCLEYTPTYIGCIFFGTLSEKSQGDPWIILKKTKILDYYSCFFFIS